MGLKFLNRTEQHRHVDVDSLGDKLLDGNQPCLVAGTLIIRSGCVMAVQSWTMVYPGNDPIGTVLIAKSATRHVRPCWVQCPKTHGWPWKRTRRNVRAPEIGGVDIFRRFDRLNTLNDTATHKLSIAHSPAHPWTLLRLCH